MYIIVIPTYNEKENIPKLIAKLDKLYGKLSANISVLIADDSSPDGTRQVVEDYVRRHKLKLNVKVITKSEKTGLREAYLNAFRHVLKNEPKLKGVVQMDADLSHDPKYVAKHLKNLQEGYDLSVGSRFVHGGSIKDLGIRRRFFSRNGNRLNRLVLSKDVRDYTGGYNGLSKRALLYLTKADVVVSKGLHFQIELKYRLIKPRVFKVTEFPVVCVDRVSGATKMGGAVSIESVRQLFSIRTRKVGRP